MGKLAIRVSLLIATLSWLSMAHAAPEAPHSRADSLLGRGDALLERSDTAATAWTAIGFFREAQKVGATPFAVSWRLARGYYLLSRIAKKTGRGDQRHLARRGYQHGLQATRKAPRRVEGHFWAALSVGSYGETLGILSAIRHGIRGKLRRHLDASLRIDPGYDRGGPDRVLAIYHHSLPWPLKSNSKAVRHFKRSLSHDPLNPSTYFFFAETLDDQGQRATARRMLSRCLQIKPTTRTDRAYKQRCQGLLHSWK